MRKISKQPQCMEQCWCLKPVLIRRPYKQPQEGNATHGETQQLSQQRNASEKEEKNLSNAGRSEKCQPRILFPVKISFKKQKQNKDVLRHTEAEDLSWAGLWRACPTGNVLGKPSGGRGEDPPKAGAVNGFMLFKSLENT